MIDTRGGGGPLPLPIVGATGAAAGATHRATGIDISSTDLHIKLFCYCVLL
jgi:hypothetical protein